MDSPVATSLLLMALSVFVLTSPNLACANSAETEVSSVLDIESGPDYCPTPLAKILISIQIQVVEAAP